MNPGVSIIICTYNGSDRLQDTIRHIALQNVREDIPWEVIIIDNNSTDNSAAIARKEWSKYSCVAPFIVQHQPKQGLTMAREMGIRTAKYDYVVLCDDDNWLAPDYVNVAYGVMEYNPSIGILGALGELIYEYIPPSWLLKLNLLAGGPQAAKSGKVKSNRVYGAGCVLRKSAYELLQQMNFKFMLSDRKGSQLTSGGDHELCYVLALAGYDIWYDQALKFKHYITKERLTWEYWIKYVRESSTCRDVLEPYKMILSGAEPTQMGFFQRLTRNFIYFFIRFIPVCFKKLTTSRKSDNHKVVYLKYILLKEQILYCIFHSAMKANFFKIVEFKRKLEGKAVILRQAFSLQRNF